MSPQKPRKVSLTIHAVEPDAFAKPSEYYGESHGPRQVARSRTYSAHDPMKDHSPGYKLPRRRLSHDVQGHTPGKYLINVNDTRASLLKREDTDGNIQITADDHGPKTLSIGTAASAGYHKFDVRGTYMLSNLLQELTLAQAFGRKYIVLDEVRLNENPVDRFARLVRDQFWPNLTRRIDGSNVFQVAEDTKDRSGNARPRIYVPRGAPEQYEYYQRVAREHPEKGLEVLWLHEDPSNSEYVRDLNEAPGLLAIEVERVENTPDGKPDWRGLPFIVPGGRFNELYGWDSYMETLGLLINGQVDICESMVRHFCFCIQHYGKILNANRTYYLCRSQPPFLTDMALRVYDQIKHRPDSREFLRTAMLAAIKDYYGTWMSKPRLDEASGLSCYRPGGLGVPPETEAGHFRNKLGPFAERHNMTHEEFIQAYNYGKVHEPELDRYFEHDRAVRESGHDTTNRLDGKGYNLATIDLNSLLYKIEMDIARTIRNLFGDRLDIPEKWRAKGQPAVESAAAWDRRAKKRRETMNKLMWDEKKGMFFDFNVVHRWPTDYETATTFWAMWSGVASTKQAKIMVDKALPLFEMHGGLASGTEKSRGAVSLDHPNRQWDYPYGWAPQQILAWVGMQRYGFDEVAQRLAYRWIYMCTKAFVDFNGVVVEKYNVTEQIKPHKVTAEYGNQGADFKGVATEGFGWVNASYVYGLTLVNSHMKRALGALVNWDKFQDMMNAASKHKAEEIIDQSREHTSEAVFRAAENETHRVLPPAHGEEKTDVPVHAAEVETEHKSAEEGAH